MKKFSDAPGYKPAYLIQLDYKSSRTGNDIAVLQISDILGRKMANYVLNPIENKLVLDLTEFAEGVYTYQIMVNDIARFNNKLIVIKP